MVKVLLSMHFMFSGSAAQTSKFWPPSSLSSLSSPAVESASDEPSPLLASVVESLPDGRALDVATGAGRNALFLAEHGYRVDAVDVSEEALAIARDRAAGRSVEDVLVAYPYLERADVLQALAYQRRENERRAPRDP